MPGHPHRFFRIRCPHTNSSRPNPSARKAVDRRAVDRWPRAIAIHPSWVAATRCCALIHNFNWRRGNRHSCALYLLLFCHLSLVFKCVRRPFLLLRPVLRVVPLLLCHGRVIGKHFGATTRSTRLIRILCRTAGPDAFIDFSHGAACKQGHRQKQTGFDRGHFHSLPQNCFERRPSRPRFSNLRISRAERGRMEMGLAAL